MIEPALYFVLGFLSAGLIALIVAPALWSRAVRLTRRRIEASQPLSLAEIKADRDGLRADFAVTSRRLEMAVADLRHKNADQRIAVDRAHGRIRDAEAENLRLTEALAARISELEARQTEIGDLQTLLERSRSEVAQRNELISGLEMRIGELNADVDGRKVEIASLGTQLEASGSRHDATAEELRGAEARISAMEAELERRAAVIAQERERADRLMMDLVAARSSLRSETGSGRIPVQALARDDNERPEIVRLTQTNDALEAQIRALTAERDALGHDLATLKVRELGKPADAEDMAMLRERLGDIAAKVASFAASREGPASTVDRLLEQPASPDVPANLDRAASVFATGADDRNEQTMILPRSGERKSPSLAERIQALRAAAGPSNES